MLLEAWMEGGRQPSRQELKLPRTLAHDRSELKGPLRRGLQAHAASPQAAQAVFAAAAPFERCVLLLNSTPEA
jgi:hypothetical protein